MPAVCLYFQLHQPYRLRRYSVFDTDRHYFDDFKNAELLRLIAHRCYLPANQILLELTNKFNGQFKVAFSISGVLLEQFEEHAPEVLASFRKLAGTGAVEFLSETYYHSLAFLYSRTEFKAQVDLHRQKIKHLFDQEPTVFRHTELVYNNDLAAAVAGMGFEGVLAEGVDAVLGERPAGEVYTPPGGGPLRVLTKNYRLSDDIAFRFSDRNWALYPLFADQFARRVGETPGPLVNLFMDYETFGEHQKADTGILEFLRYLPIELLKAGNTFTTPAAAVRELTPAGEIDVPHFTSWADTERDLSAWLGNAMQTNAMHELYRLENPLKDRGEENLLADWRRLTTSDHFYYMCTKYWADGQIHRYFSPYESPYDSYINFMNVLDNLQSRIR
jgi:alpha-amylase